jgi:hypothetical protein
MKACEHLKDGDLANLVIFTDPTDPGWSHTMDLCDDCLNFARSEGIPVHEPAGGPQS